MKIVFVILAELAGAALAAEAASGARSEDLNGQIAGLSTRVSQLSQRVQTLAQRIARAQTTIPTPEEFRQKVAEARKKIEALRGVVNERWKEVKRLAETRGATVDQRAVRSVVPQALAGDTEFLQARARAVAAEELFDVLEKRLIQVMLTTTHEKPAPAAEAAPAEAAIAREWENLAGHQKALSDAVQNAAKKAVEAKVELDPATLLEPGAAAVGTANRAFVESREKALAQQEARDASAELVAKLEFLKAAGPRYAGWK